MKVSRAAASWSVVILAAAAAVVAFEVTSAADSAGAAASPAPLKLLDPGPPGGPPADAVVLLGPSSSDADLATRWTNRKDPGRTAPPPWKVKDGVVTVEPGTGDMVTRESFGDIQLHLEWALQPRDPSARGEADSGNSGIKFHEVYEIQIIDSYGKVDTPLGQAGAVYKQHAPLTNVCRKPGEWETFDIVFRPPRFEGDRLVADGRFTVFQNGVLIQDNAKILGRTNDPQPMPREYKRPFFLQDHGGRVRFRNIWVRPLEPRAD